jgi:hypothetical protein
MEINISVPYTDSQLSADAVEDFLDFLECDNMELEVFLSSMYDEGYNMDIFE